MKKEKDFQNNDKEEAIERIERMELCFDVLQKALLDESRDVTAENWFKGLLGELKEYYNGGQWLCDYELDEKGLLPKKLKRGVLSQDAVYDFLEEVKKRIND